MIAAIILSALAMTLIVGVRYLITADCSRQDQTPLPRTARGQGPQMRREIGWSLASAAIYASPRDRRWGWQERGLDADYSEPPRMGLGGCRVIDRLLLIHDTGSTGPTG